MAAESSPSPVVGDGSRNPFGLPLLIRIIFWFATIFSPKRVRRSDVRRFIRWISGKPPSRSEVTQGWRLVNGLVWLVAWLFHGEYGYEPSDVARSLYQGAELLRNIRDNFVSFRVFTDLLEVRGQKFKDRDWSFFDSHAGRIFDSGAIRTMTTLLQFSDFDLHIYDLCGEFVRKNVADGIKAGAPREMFDATRKLSAGLMRFRGHRKHLITRLATYFHNLEMYAIGICDERAIDLMKRAEVCIRKLGDKEPTGKNSNAISVAVQCAFIYANDGSARIYKARHRMAPTTIVIREPPPPTRTEVAKEMLPGIDPVRFKAALSEIYEQGRKAGEAIGFQSGVTAAFREINVRGLLADHLKSMAGTVERSVKKGIDESIVGKISAGNADAVPVRAVAQQLNVNRNTVGRWLKWCETGGKEGIKCPVPGFSPLLLACREAFEAWVPTYRAWKATGRKDKRKRDPKSVTAALKQDEEDVSDMFSAFSRGENY